MKCRHCKSDQLHQFVDLGFQPPSNAYRLEDQLKHEETYFPLRVNICEKCFLAQTEDYTSREVLFDEKYPYFSSTSTSWLKHAEEYSKKIINRLKLGKKSFVVELACNDGYLLKNFKNTDIECLGVEPTLSTANAAEALGIEVIKEFFGQKLSHQICKSHKKADLIIANNVYAHVPNINDFTLGIKNLLADNGVVTLEFPHLLNLIKEKQFDTIYHEHFSYFSLHAIKKIFEASELRVFHIEMLSTHGGSLRVYGCHIASSQKTSATVTDLLNAETAFGLTSMATYLGFQSEIEILKNKFLETLIKIKNENKTIVGYGAAAKGNTLLNYAGVKKDLLPVVFDASKAKQGKYLPGSHIPILSIERMLEQPTDFILVIPWNIKTEIISQLKGIVDEKVQFLTAVPSVEVH